MEKEGNKENNPEKSEKMIINDLKDNIDDEFTGLCKEKTHFCELEYFCKTHNILCCTACISKLTNEYNGHHNKCDFCNIRDIEKDKKNMLKKHLINLDALLKSFNESFIQINNKANFFSDFKNNIIKKINTIFNELREAVNKREKELLLELDKMVDNLNLNKIFIKKEEISPSKIKNIIDFGKKIEKEWKSEKLSFFIFEELKFEKMMDEIYKYKNNSKIFKIKFKYDENSLNTILKAIKNFGIISIDEGIKFRNFESNREYLISGKSGNIVTKINSNRWIGTYTEESLDTSIEEHIIKVKILNSLSNWFYVGISNEFNIPSSTWSPSQLKGWFYHFGVGGLYCGPPKCYHNYQNNPNLKRINKYEDIKLIMNMKNGSLKFIINNEERESYQNIPLDKPLYPSVYLYNNNDSVELFYS